MDKQATHPQLKRRLGVFAAVMLGLGAMVGTGVFVSTGIAAGLAGPAVIIAVVLAALVAVCNGLSSAQLAASHPVSGGSYEYGYQYLSPQAGFTAGWMFLLAKSASAATAALGFAGYLQHALEIRGDDTVLLALAAVAVLTGVVMAGIERSHQVNVAIVSITLGSLLLFVVLGLGRLDMDKFRPFMPRENGGFSLQAILSATALMFVAYTGYGRIATLGEEVRDPAHTIPKAIIATMSITALLYTSVAVVGVGLLGAADFSQATAGEAAPLAIAAESFALPYAAEVLSMGAITAMLGVLLNLLLGLSRMLLAMSRRSDMPATFRHLNASQTTPTHSVLAVGVLIGLLVLIGDVRVTWSFSAFTVLIYYAITNWAALRLADEQRLYPRWISASGLIACLFLAFWIQLQILLVGALLIAAGLLWQRWRRGRV
ncbi:amino acid permease [Proteobacteria bacterium 005FR1]|nr:amino acid permease [Proteobacteria bacterium 005FR1]